MQRAHFVLKQIPKLRSQLLRSPERGFSVIPPSGDGSYDYVKHEPALVDAGVLALTARIVASAALWPSFSNQLGEISSMPITSSKVGDVGLGIQGIERLVILEQTQRVREMRCMACE